MKQIYIESYYRSGYSPVLNTGFMQYINNILGHPKRKSIEQRLKIMEFGDEFGVEAARKAFGKSRATIYLWKQQLKVADGKLSALAPGDKSPIHKRKRVVHPFIEGFVVEYRAAHPGADKATPAPALAAACQHQGIKPVSESTVGRIIHDLKVKGRLPRSTRITINGRTGRLLVRYPANKEEGAQEGVPATVPRRPHPDGHGLYL